MPFNCLCSALYDFFLLFPSQSMENGIHYMAVAFAMQLVKLLLVDERSVSHITEADLFHTIETLMRTCAHSRANAPEGLALISGSYIFLERKCL